MRPLRPQRQCWVGMLTCQLVSEKFRESDQSYWPSGLILLVLMRLLFHKCTQRHVVNGSVRQSGRSMVECGAKLSMIMRRRTL